jgi:hypothetical protein
MASIALMRGLKTLSVTPGGSGGVVLAPQSQHVRVCLRYSMTSGLIGGTSITCRRFGFGSSPRSGAPHSSHDGGLMSTILSTLSGERSWRVVPLWPGWPPRFRPDGFLFGRAATFGGSDDGGFPGASTPDVGPALPRRGGVAGVQADPRLKIGHAGEELDDLLLERAILIEEFFVGLHCISWTHTISADEAAKYTGLCG